VAAGADAEAAGAGAEVAGAVADTGIGVAAISLSNASEGASFAAAASTRGTPAPPLLPFLWGPAVPPWRCPFFFFDILAS